MGLILLLGVCTAAGLLKAFELKRRIDQLKALLLTVEQWEREMEFSNADIPRLMGISGEGKDCPVLMHLRYEPTDRSLEACYFRAKQETYKEMCFQSDDWIVADRFFSQFGKSGTVGQKDFCRGIRAQLQAQIEQAEAFRLRHGKLYAAGGFLCGMLVFLLLI